MNKKDFKFIKYNKEYEDYWFKIEGDTQEYLTKRFMEQSLVCVSEIVYSKVEDSIGVKLFFPFNARIDLVEFQELKNIIIDIIKNM